jgi:hypothetical protein
MDASDFQSKLAYVTRTFGPVLLFPRSGGGGSVCLPQIRFVRIHASSDGRGNLLSVAIRPGWYVRGSCSIPP